MNISYKSILAFTGIVVLSGTLAACTSSQRFGGSSPAAAPQPTPITPVQTGTVQSSDLPPIGGTGTTASRTGNTGLYDPAPQSQTQGGFASLGDVNGAPASGGRDLSGPLTMEKLLGGWTVTVGAEQCRLNLTYTAKGASGRYRASTPGCTQETLADVTSWQLLGNQIQFYNDANELVGTVFKSVDNRLAGTLAGGQSIAMTG